MSTDGHSPRVRPSQTAGEAMLRAEGTLPLTWNSAGSLSERKVCSLEELWIVSGTPKPRVIVQSTALPFLRPKFRCLLFVTWEK